jgi:hypothetical protein
MADSSTTATRPSSQVINLGDAHTPNFHEREREKEGTARRRIALMLVRAYVGLLALAILVPMIAVELIGSGSNEVAALKAASESAASIVTGVAAVLGFVLGYYFKSEDYGP